MPPPDTVICPQPVQRYAATDGLLKQHHPRAEKGANGRALAIIPEKVGQVFDLSVHIDGDWLTIVQQADNSQNRRRLTLILYTATCVRSMRSQVRQDSR
jgi:hypothetical protein